MKDTLTIVVPVDSDDDLDVIEHGVQAAAEAIRHIFEIKRDAATVGDHS